MSNEQHEYISQLTEQKSELEQTLGKKCQELEEKGQELEEKGLCIFIYCAFSNLFDQINICHR